MPTITVRKFKYDELKKNLKPDDKIAIISCDGCAKQSDDLGGQVGLKNLTEKLIADGFNVVSSQLLYGPCSSEILMKFLDNGTTRNSLENANILIPLACNRGHDTLKENLSVLDILTVTETLGKGTFSPESGARLTEPEKNIGLNIESPQGITIPDAAKKLKLHPGSF